MNDTVAGRVRALLEYLDDEPESEGALPFAVALAVDQLREAMDRSTPWETVRYPQRRRFQRAGNCSRAYGKVESGD
jgi:hypothetical protein